MGEVVLVDAKLPFPASVVTTGKTLVLLMKRYTNQVTKTDAKTYHRLVRCDALADCNRRQPKRCQPGRQCCDVGSKTALASAPRRQQTPRSCPSTRPPTSTPLPQAPQGHTRIDKTLENHTLNTKKHHCQSDVPPAGVIMRMQLLPVSATMMLPDASTLTPRGALN